MYKKIITTILILLIVIVTILYLRPIDINSLIQPFSNESLPTKMEIAIFFSSHSVKELDITNDVSIGELIALIENMTVKRNISIFSVWRR
jgi:uncharacterized membrane protein